MPIWTKEQKTAIESRDSALLVSAAAGSGKTAVLVERVLQMITDKENPIDIDSLLLITFTNAAAAEMKERISAALLKALETNPMNSRLRKQMLLVHRAEISTVHAMCLKLARENAASLGIAPDFRLMDEQEGKILRAQTMEEVLDRAYESGDEGFFALCDLLTAGRDDKRLSEVILSTYNKIQAHANPIAFLETVKSNLSSEQMNTPHCQILLHQAKLAVEYSLECLSTANRLLCGMEELEKYQTAIHSDIMQAKKLLEILKKENWDDCLHAVRDIAFDTLRSPRGYEDKAFLEKIKVLREVWKTTVKDIKEKWIAAPAESIIYDRKLTAPALCALADMVIIFDEAFARAKRKRNIADFNDLEHFAISLLYDGAHPSELAESLAEKYTEILVDEYQDTNEVQDAIFRALSKNQTNLFMVGDMKQSIYGFRLADPFIFLEKYHQYADAEAAAEGMPRRVILGQNFRSRSMVLDTCNYLFTAVMGEMVGDIQYTDKEALHLGAKYPEETNERYKTEVLLIDAKKLGEDDDAINKTELEAKLAAKRIRELIDQGFPILDKQSGILRPILPNDIAILLRSPRTKARIFISALEKVGLSGIAEERSGLLETTEVGAIVSLLMIIDNPRQDVDLIGAMRSPLFGFSEQELAEIRLLDKSVSFYDALVIGQETNEKVAKFLEELAYLREFAADQPVYRLIWEIYNRTGAAGLYGAMPKGTQRQNNLYSFFERARAFEEQGYKGLFSFVKLLRAMKEMGEDFQTTLTENSDNTVRIMSIHKSKGLEFPVVIMADCAKRFNESDLKEPILIHKELGISSKCRDLSRGIQYDTAERRAVALEKRQEMVSEELRVLYVALTRAKEKLILTCASGTLASSLANWAHLAENGTLSQYALSRMNAPLGWILTPLLMHPATRELREQYELEIQETIAENDSFIIKRLLPEDILVSNAEEVIRFENIEEISVAMPPALEYSRSALSDLPSKLTATGIAQGYRAEEAAEQTPTRNTQKTLRTPMFQKEKRRLTPSEIGTAHHLFMQFCSFEEDKISKKGIEEELLRMKENLILTKEQAEAVDIAKIHAFFKSDIFQKIMKQNEIHREFKFSVLIPAAEYYEEAKQHPDEKILLQGVIDCLIETKDGFIILDFKTDHVLEDKLYQRSEKYKAQLDAYAAAVEAIFEKKVIRKILYFFMAGRSIEFSAYETV